jgi:uncharacterized protein (TIGR00297 family)
VSVPVLIAAGFALNLAASLVVFWRGSLDAGGAAVGVVVGTVIFACGGPFFWMVMMVFFVTSTAFGYLGRRRKEALKKIHQKGGRRDMFQVLANGGAGAACALLYRLTGSPAWAVGFAVSFASSNADTWASEVGVLSRGQPVSLVTFRAVPRGVSGGVSVLGSSMALGGAIFIGLIFALGNLVLGIPAGGFVRLGLVVALGGFAGSVVDSLLGATIQAQYSGAAGELTERPLGDDGSRNELVRGFRFINNDVVNFASCALATLFAVLLAL